MGGGKFPEDPRSRDRASGGSGAGGRDDAEKLRPSIAVIIAIVAASAWATVCNNAKALVKGQVLKADIWSLCYIAAAVGTPGRWMILSGVLAGTIIYLLLIALIVARPRLVLNAGDRFYTFKYALAKIVPLAYIAPEPLSPLFEPAGVFYVTPGIWGLPVWRISIFDPQSLHEYMAIRGITLSSHDLEWESVVDRFRRSLRMLGILEALGKLESINLDGVALAASARLALHHMPTSARLASPRHCTVSRR